ncbi:hypothetical protein R1sor_027219 [Riccia sorocarpa]|uniref:Uncharacterized protein n=1 Tax=Riccia sorocarpa TaxID=122646 RepID=A0ABD3GF35_9MARC
MESSSSLAKIVKMLESNEVLLKSVLSEVPTVKSSVSAIQLSVLDVRANLMGLQAKVESTVGTAQKQGVLMLDIANRQKAMATTVAEQAATIHTLPKAWGESAGLDEVAGKDTQSMVKEFLQDVLKVATPRITYAARVGRSDRGTRTILLKFASVEDRAVVLGNRGMLKGRRVWLDLDLTMAQAADKKQELVKVKSAMEEGWVAFLRDETWECSEENLVDLPGFVRKASVWNSKRYVKGRGYGGLVVWAREGLMMEVEVAHLDPRKQFVSIRLNERGSISFLVFAYFAPSGSHVYRNLEGEETFLGITNELIKLRDVGPTWIMP